MVANFARQLDPRPLAPPRTLPGDELLDPKAAGFSLGMGRSKSFPFPQYRASDPYRTVFFDVGEGPQTVVMIHGLGANATHFEPVAREMARNHRIIGIDLVGCGWSEKPDIPYNVNLLRDHLLDFLDRRGVGRCNLVGHSMGGAVCLAAALKRPGQFDSLALICAAGVAPLPAWMRTSARYALRRQLLLPLLVMGHTFIIKNIFVTTARNNENVRWFKKSFARDALHMPNFRQWVRVCETLCKDLAQRDFSDQLQHLHMPVLAVWGDHDKLTAVPSVMRSLDSIRQIRTVMLKDCGHMPMIEYPEQTTWHLERFLGTPP